MTAAKEVSGFEGSLEDAMDQGIVEAPGLLEFNQWQVWRRDFGRRPTLAKDGATTTTRLEAELWRSTMAMLHGDGWKADLASARGTAKVTRPQGGATGSQASALGAVSASAAAAALPPGLGEVDTSS